MKNDQFIEKPHFYPICLSRPHIGRIFDLILRKKRFSESFLDLKKPVEGQKTVFSMNFTPYF